MQTLAKEQTTAANFVVNLEKQHEWIIEEHEYVAHVYLGPTSILLTVTTGNSVSPEDNTTSPPLM